MEMEDDLFFADLSKQISLLIMDDEEEEGDDDNALAPPLWHSYPFQDLHCATATTPRQHHQHQQQQQQQQPPQHVQEKNHHSMREISKGTGVFIPRFAQPRRKRGTNHHSTRHNSSRSNNYTRSNHCYRHQQQLDHGTTRLSQEESKANHFINPDKL